MIEQNSPYRTPSADVIVPEKIPSGFIQGKLTPGKLRFAAGASALYLFCIVIIVVLSFFSGINDASDPYQRWVDGFTAVSTVVWIYLMLMLKSVLNLRLEFTRTDWFIYTLIGMSVVWAAQSLLVGDSDDFFDPMAIAYFALMIPYGIVTLLLGMRLLKIDMPYPCLRLYAWTCILSGGCMASVVLFVLAFPLSIVATVAMYRLFNYAAEEAQAAS